MKYLCERRHNDNIFGQMLSSVAIFTKMRSCTQPQNSLIGQISFLVPFSVLDNIPQCTESPSTTFLTTSTFILRTVLLIPELLGQ